jgi:hypothetical protein
MVDKLGLGQVFLRVLRFFPVNIIPTWLSKLTACIVSGMNNRAIGGRRSETQSYPIDMTIIIILVRPTELIEILTAVI